MQGDLIINDDEVTMRIYNVNAAGEPTRVVFAHNFDDAALIFATWRSHLTGLMPGEFNVGVAKKREITGTAAHLEKALAADVHGIGIYDEFYGWIVLAPEWIEK